MINFDNIDDLVERYLRRQLNAADKLEVENRLQNSDAFAAAFENSRRAFVLREQLVANDLGARLQQWRNESPPPQKSFRNRFGRWIWAVALLLCSGAAVLWFWPQGDSQTPVIQQETLPQQPPASAPSVPMAGQENNAPSVPQSNQPVRANRYEALAVAQYRRPDFAGNIRGNDPAAGNNPMSAPMAFMNAAQWKKAIDALDQLPPAYRIDADYLRGHAFFNLKKYEQAATVFNQLHNSIRYGEAAQWYGILALLPNYEKHKTILLQQLKTMAEDEGHTYQKEAKNLLSGMRY